MRQQPADVDTVAIREGAWACGSYALSVVPCVRGRTACMCATTCCTMRVVLISVIVCVAPRPNYELPFHGFRPIVRLTA
eukprot:2949949-Prymnesium_polylepis.1